MLGYLSWLGGNQSLAASAQALGQTGESSLSFRGQNYECCKRSNDGCEPYLQFLCSAANVSYAIQGINPLPQDSRND